jgi:lipopolysaccharide/colanic/teichoic acid biosynthesis glycosyltransferase
VPLAAPGRSDPSAAYIELKCVVEAIIALAALVVLAPLLLLFAVLIALESRGGVFYPDERESRGGRTFRCLKFRTMFAGADTQQRRLYASNELDGPQFKLDHDPRVTKIGRFLRGASLDELPQLINVVRGEMSLIGPRPSPFRENQTCVPWRVGRLSVRPGITGLWQVCRHDRKAGDFHQWIYYDLLYVRHMSALLDLKILVATILTLGGRRPVPLAWLLGAKDATERP